jgi:hypothetical protein
MTTETDTLSPAPDTACSSAPSDGYSPGDQRLREAAADLEAKRGDASTRQLALAVSTSRTRRLFIAECDLSSWRRAVLESPHEAV